MTKTARVDGHQRVTDPTAALSSVRSSVRVLLPTPKTDYIKLVVSADRVLTLMMPIHDPATLEKFRQAATACRTSRTGQRQKSRSISDAPTTAATGNGGVGRCAVGHESAALVTLSPSSLGRQVTSPQTAESRFFDRDAADDEGMADECGKLRRGRGRRRTLTVVTTARWLQQLLPSKTGDNRAVTSRPGERPPLSPPVLAVTSDDESATSDAETNLLRRASDRDAAGRQGDGVDQHRSRDTFYSSTGTDRVRLSTGSDSASARRPSSGDESYSQADVFQCVRDNSDASTVTDHKSRRLSSPDADAVSPPVTTTRNDASLPDADDVNQVFDADLSLLKPKTREVLRFDFTNMLVSVLTFCLFFILRVNYM